MFSEKSFRDLSSVLEQQILKVGTCMLWLYEQLIENTILSRPAEVVADVLVC